MVVTKSISVTDLLIIWRESVCMRVWIWRVSTTHYNCIKTKLTWKYVYVSCMYTQTLMINKTGKTLNETKTFIIKLKASFLVYCITFNAGTKKI